MNKNKWLMLTAVALMLSAALTFLIIRIVQRRLQPTAQTAPMVVADKKLVLGMRLSQDSVRIVNWPKGIALEGSFNDVKQVLGRGVITSLAPNEPILESKLAPKEAGAGLTPAIPDGMRAVSVKVNDVIGVAGFVLPGTRVDVIMTGAIRPDEPNKEMAAEIILENVQVLAAGQNVVQDANGKPQNVQVVTLLVTPEQAQQLALAGVDAKIQLALRNPLDTDEKDRPAVHRTALFGGLDIKPELGKSKPTITKPKPKPIPTAAKIPEPPKPVEHKVSIEVYLGKNKDTVTFDEKAD